MKKEEDTLIVFTMQNCPNCPNAKKLCEEVSKEMKIKFKVIDIKEDFLTALIYQVMETPSIALNDETIFFSEVPSKQELKKEIKNRMG
ncbi:MAG: thioredoxin family protein [Candidatus Nanoarchaeia archaeon]|nr:thioredoxin family protein [Candidatus Nanoarchaeia archaeon]MDD5054018.1 thioredoxin family protein [Candidatus Nanoarchaeia archaeon]MDD5499611.1 thioredoxin family protein [Candidatus Nanoarchaeia archaeon]